MLTHFAQSKTQLSEELRDSLFYSSSGRMLLVALVLFLSHCKIVTPDSFLDATPDSNELLKTMNVRNNGELWSGVVAGDLPVGVVGVDVKFDDGAWKKAEIIGNRWRVFVPTGAEAAAGKQRWQVGSKHQVSLKALGNSGNSRSPIAITFIRQTNKDINGDGYADVIVGAYQNQGTGAADKGAAYIFYGSALGVINQPTSGTVYTCTGPWAANNCSVLQNPDDEATGRFGTSVALAGDANGDGYADVIVGAYQNQGAGASNKGTAYIFYGSASGVTNQPTSGTAYTCTGPGALNNCSVIQNPDNESGGRFGYSVAFAGDANGDGYADSIVGAWSNQGAGASNKGTAYIFYGSASGVTNQPTSGTAYTCTGPGGPNNCSVLQNPDNEANGYFGVSVAFAGDANGDGYADIIVGAYFNQGGGAADKGAAYIFYGSASGVTNQPTSGTAYTCTGPAALNNCSVLQNPEDETSGYFGYSVAFAGDANGDGYADVIVGAYGNQGSGTLDKGAAYIFYGSALGVTNQPTSGTAYTCTGPGGLNNCSVLQNPDDENSGYFGNSVALAGDANGDGYADVIVGAYGNQGVGASNKGTAYIFYGSDLGVTNQPMSVTPYTCIGPGALNNCSVLQNPDDEATANFGRSVAFAGDANGDGYADVIVGAYSNQGVGASDKGAVYIFYGSASGVTNQSTSGTAYTCTGPGSLNNCSVLQNPEDEATGNLGVSVGFLAPALRPSPASLNRPGTPSPFMARGWGWGQDALPARREEDIA